VEDAERIGIRELRQHASRYVAMAKAGLRVPVTDRGELVAYLVPAEEGGSVYERLVAAGKVRPAVGNLLDLLPPPPAEPGEPSLSDTLQQMRDEEDY
jgi:prevent-host-death family protein